MNQTPSNEKLKELNIKELERLVQYHNERYWFLNDPEISDVDYDRIVEALRQKDPNNAVLNELGGDDGGRQLGRGDKVIHMRPMLSLDKCYEKETLEKWFDKFEGGVIATPKIDGVAVSIIYNSQGKLLYASTRGDGRFGEIITATAEQIVDLPQRINNLAANLNVALSDFADDEPFLEVRGEAYMPLSVFRRDFKHEFKSPRNLTAGALKQKDSSKTLNFKIHFFAYGMLLPDGVDGPNSELRKFELLHELGFSHVPVVDVDVNNPAGAFEEIQSQRSTYDFELDGVVYKANLVKVQDALGYTAHHPRYAIAYKFQGDFDESVLREVHWSVSRTGVINPVAIIDPVSLSGAVVTRCSLHNLSIMEHLTENPDGLKLNSKVLVTRRGGVIPHLEKVLEDGDVPVHVPEVCPGCGASTRREGDFLIADHAADCSTTQIRRIEHFATVMGIKGFGPKLLERLYDEEVVTQPVDFYSMVKEDLMLLERVGDKLADRLLEAVRSSYRTPLAVFLRALGIDELGRHVSVILAGHVSSLEELFGLTVEELAEVHTIGEVIAEKVVSGLARRREEIEELVRLAAIDFTAPVVEDDKPEAEGPLSGRSFLFTGALESMKREEAQERVRRLGGSTPSSVSKELDYLVIGDKDYARFESGWRSSKLKKVEANNAGREEGGTLVISESTFLSMLE